MEIFILIATMVGLPLVILALFVAFLYGVKIGVRRLTRRWANKRLKLYRQSGLTIKLSSSAIDAFGGSIAMTCYGLIIILLAGIILYLGYKIADAGLHPDFTILWGLSGVMALFGAVYAGMFGHYAYTEWRNSFLPLASEYARITKGMERPFTMK